MHEANLSIIHELDIVHGHIFPYSSREGTPAARMPQMRREIIKKRAADLRAAVSMRRAAWLESLTGQPHSVLAERDGTGYTPHFARLRLPAGTAAGALVTIEPVSVQEGLLI